MYADYSKLWMSVIMGECTETYINGQLHAYYIYLLEQATLVP